MRCSSPVSCGAWRLAPGWSSSRRSTATAWAPNWAWPAPSATPWCGGSTSSTCRSASTRSATARPPASRPRSLRRGPPARPWSPRPATTGSTRPAYPASFPGVTAVGALSAEGRERAAFSNHGAWVEVYAPGERVQSSFVRGREDPNLTEDKELGRVPLQHRAVERDVVRLWLRQRSPGERAEPSPAVRRGAGAGRLEGGTGRGGHRGPPPHGRDRRRPPGPATRLLTGGRSTAAGRPWPAWWSRCPCRPRWCAGRCASGGSRRRRRRSGPSGPA